MKLSIVIPVYNEERAIKSTIVQVKKVMSRISVSHEIIIVNDCSTDRTGEILADSKGIRLLKNPHNMGYGASLKNGIRNANGEWILITDADGTYPIKDIPRLLRYTKDYDMVVGSRTKKGVKIPLSRKPAKFMIKLLANFLTGKKIVDINSGLRVFKKSLALEFFHLFPSRFSFTSTITLAAFCNDYAVKYVPINYFKRVGKSSISPKDFTKFITLIFKIVMYFKPLKFFALPGVFLIILGIIWGIYQFSTTRNIAQFPLLLILSGIQIGFLGLLSDLIIKSRNKPNFK